MKSQNHNRNIAALFGKQHRVTLLLGALFLLVAGTLGGIRLYARHLAASDVSTPIPPAPDQPEKIKGDSVNKTQVYGREIRKEKQRSREGNEDEVRMDRITMNWKHVSQGVKADSQKETVKLDTLSAKKPKLAPQKSVSRTAPRRRNYRHAAIPKKEVEKPPQQPDTKRPLFNLQVQQKTDEDTEKPEANLKALQFVRAIIAGEFKVRSGETITLQLLEPVHLNGRELPELSLLPGRLSIGSGRLNIEVQHVNLGGSVIPVSWQCYDQHMVKGLPYDGSTSRAEDRVQERLTRRAGQDINRNLPRIPYVSDAAEGIIDAAKGIRKNKRTKVNLPNNYEVLLKIN